MIFSEKRSKLDELYICSALTNSNNIKQYFADVSHNKFNFSDELKVPSLSKP